MRFNNFSTYMRATYGGNLEKICLDGAFTCPNRDGTRSTGGCIFCGARGAGDHIEGKVDIKGQLRNFFLARPKVKRAIAYFQNFTSTYAPLDVLECLYNDAISDPRVLVLAIGTRPDCITEDICKLLKKISTRVDVWVELGLQTSSDTVAQFCNRAYKTQEFDKAYQLLNKYGIGVVAHMMVGLPNEDFEGVKRTLEYLNRFHLFGIKIHSVYVMRGTKLERMFQNGEYTPITREEYVKTVVYILTHLPPDLIVHRITGDCVKSMLVAPEWNRDKNATLKEIYDLLERENLTQGCFYQK